MFIATAESQLAGLVLSSAIFGLALILLAIGLWSRHWPKTKGTITISIFDTEWENTGDLSKVALKKRDKFYFAYEFEVNGVVYACSQIRSNGDLDWNTSTSGLSSAADKARRYREGQIVDVYYWPPWPKLCCLEPGGFTLPIILGLAGVLLFLIAR
jgi:hypothetical protein